MTQAQLFLEPIEPRPIDVLFYEELKDRRNDRTAIGELARKTLNAGIKPGDSNFPNYRNYYDLDVLFAGVCDMPLWEYRKKHPKRHLVQ